MARSGDGRCVELTPGVEWTEQTGTLYIIPSLVVLSQPVPGEAMTWGDAAAYAFRLFMKCSFAHLCKYVVLIRGRDD